MRNLIILLLLSTLAFSCDPQRPSNIPDSVEGFVPVYSTDLSTVTQISYGPPRPTVNGGKMYAIHEVIFQVEKDSGIHIIDYSYPQFPQKFGFIRSFLCKELAVKNGMLYTNNLDDLVVIDISDPSNVHLVSRTESVFPDLALQYPPKENTWDRVYFECPDPSKGIITSWKKQTIKEPKCWR
jgi:hypothetical protein